MEIINRARGKADGEVVAWNESESNVREEVLKRNAKAGYCNRDGTPVNVGKGDCYRKVDRKKWEKNYDRIFRNDKNKTMQ